MKLKVSAVIFYIASIIFVINGLNTMYTYGESDSYRSPGHIVGGDAYNYIIIGVRGSGLIGVGITAAVIGTGLLVWGLAKEYIDGNLKKNANINTIEYNESQQKSLDFDLK